MAEQLSPLERKTGRRYSSAGERRLFAWARAKLPRALAIERGEVPRDLSHGRAFLCDLDGRQYGPTTAAAMEAAMGAGE